MALKFYTSVVKELKLKVRKFWGQIPTFVEVTVKKLIERGPFCSPILNRVLTSIKLTWTLLDFYVFNIRAISLYLVIKILSYA